MLQRTKPYNANGRNQTEDEARAKDWDVLHLLQLYNIPFENLRADRKAKHVIVERVLRELREVQE
jgi:hypothetical protein